MVAAMGGDLMSHVQLAQIKAARNQMTEAWAHLEVSRRLDGPSDEALADRIDAALSGPDRTEAADIAWEYLEAMRKARNQLR